MISGHVTESHTGIVRPRSTRLGVSRNEEASLTPCFEPQGGLRGCANLAESMGLAPGLQLDREKTKSAFEDRIWMDNLTLARTNLEINEASYSVLKRVHHILIAHETSRLDQILKYAPVDRLSIQVLVALLASSLKAKRYLVERGRFFEKVEERLRRDEPQRTDALLRGLQ
jgi:hypothetical protein